MRRTVRRLALGFALAFGCQPDPAALAAHVPLDPAPIDPAPIDVVAPRPPADPDAAVREEWEAAQVSRNPDALRLFIARHPAHPLAEKARAQLRALGQR